MKYALTIKCGVINIAKSGTFKSFVVGKKN